MDTLIKNKKFIFLLTMLTTLPIKSMANCWFNGAGGEHTISGGSYSPGGSCSYGIVTAGNPFNSVGNVTLKVDNITVTNNSSSSYGRGILVGSTTSGSTLSTYVNNSSIVMNVGNPVAGNLIGILSESTSPTQNQSHYMTVTDTYIDLTSQNKHTNGITMYTSILGALATELQLKGNTIKVNSTNASATGILTVGTNSIVNETTSNNASTIEVIGNTESIGVQAISNFVGTSYINILSSIDVKSIQSDAFGIFSSNTANEVYKKDSDIMVTASLGTASGIKVSGASDQVIDNQAAMLISGNNVYAIEANSTGGKINLNNTQQITIEAKNNGVGLKSSNTGNKLTMLTHSGVINTVVNSMANYKGIQSDSIDGHTQINLNNGQINISQTANQSYGILSASTGQGYIETSLQNNSYILSADNSNFTAVKNTTDSGFNRLSVGNSTILLGGAVSGNAAIDMSSNTGLIEINNSGHVSALNDLAILTNNTVGLTTINNGGTILGYIQSAGGDTITFNNFTNSYYQLQYIMASTKNTVVSDFGANSIFNNSGAITFSHNHTVNMSEPTNHALFNVGTFNQQVGGVIDLTTKNNGNNNLTGDTVTINGHYVSNGGQLKINTELNGDNSVSDQLIVDGDVILGSEATLLSVIPTLNSLGIKTTNDGIKVVSVSGTSNDGAFILKTPLTAGVYEYVLDKGHANQNWYLSNILKPIGPTDPSKPEQPEIILRNPSIGAYLANQTAASALFMHTLYDRQGHANNLAGKNSNASSVWLRVVNSNTKNNSVNGRIRTDSDSNLIHLGGDIAKWQLQEGNLHLGVMGAFGQTESNVRSKYTGTAAKGKVTGYSVGLYSTLFADEAQGKGLYIDSWVQYGWYKNKVSGQAQVNKEEKYDSNNWVASLEAGYGFHLATQGNTEVMLTPQAQVSYNHYRADEHNDGNNLKVSNSKTNSFITRIGARLYGRAIEGYTAKPFIETNWLHHTAKNELSFNSEVLKDDVPKDRAEAKLGLQGTIVKNWKIWGQVGAQWGRNGYTLYEGQAGVNYQW